MTTAGNRPASSGRALRKLFLMLFLRGRGARGLRKEHAPRSVGTRLSATLGFYILMGLLALVFMEQRIFALSLYLHSMNLIFLSTFVAASAGEILFNKEEADILLHRPVSARALLWGKIGVLIEVSLWIAGSFNLIGFFVGIGAKDGGWMYPVAHAISTSLQALFCTGGVVLMYQLCLRWFGRERLDGLMTTAQVFLTVGAIVASQAVPQLISAGGAKFNVVLDSPWLWILPPAWFAALDDVVVRGGTVQTWAMAAPGVIGTAVIVWLAFGKLAQDYGAGLQVLAEVRVTRPRQSRGRRWLERLVKARPFRWGLRDSVTRAAFLLTAAYLVRDREVKLRIYPGLAPVLIMPLIFLLKNREQSAVFGLAFSANFMGFVPMLTLNLLQYSQQWQAADVFRLAPMIGPATLCRGARQAVWCFVVVPLLLFYSLIFWFLSVNVSSLALLLPGLIALPIYALIPSLDGKAVPLSQPSEEAKSAGRGLRMIVVMIISMILSGLTMWAWLAGFYRWLLVIELLVAVPLYFVLRAIAGSARWTSME